MTVREPGRDCCAPSDEAQSRRARTVLNVGIVGLSIPQENLCPADNDVQINTSIERPAVRFFDLALKETVFIVCVRTAFENSVPQGRLSVSECSPGRQFWVGFESTPRSHRDG